MTNVKLKKLFIGFLYKENILNEYLEIFQKPINYKRNFVDYIIRKKRISSLIDDSFTWADTPQGSLFWCEKHMKWSKLAKKYK